MFIWLLFLFVTVFLVYLLYSNIGRNFPPGPMPLPFIGNLLSIGAEPHTGFKKMSDKYGPLVGLMFGPHKAICLHGTALIKEGYSNLDFGGRILHEGAKFISGDEKGIVQSNGQIWVEQRRFALRNLRDFGFGKSSMEELIMVEVREFCDWLRRQDGQPVVLQDRFKLAVVNSLWKILTGGRFDHDDQKLHSILENLGRAGKTVLGFGTFKNLFIRFYPKIGKMFPNWSGWNKLVEGSLPRVTMLKEIVREHQKSVHPTIARDFIDAYLHEIQNTTNVNSSFYDSQGLHSLSSVLADFFVAGSDTTSVSLSWVQIYLLHNPRVQRKLQLELKRVIGQHRPVSLADRKQLPYTEATILETLRLSSIAGISIAHAATKDTMFHGYSIPKGTMVFANLYANHHDPSVWGSDVEEFRPERFLSANETTVVRHEALIPFSTGRRVCIGEPLAMDTFFLFTANMALNFDVTNLPGQPLPSLDYKRGQLTLAPVSTTVVMRERK